MEGTAWLPGHPSSSGWGWCIAKIRSSALQQPLIAFERHGDPYVPRREIHRRTR